MRGPLLLFFLITLINVILKSIKDKKSIEAVRETRVKELQQKPLKNNKTINILEEFKKSIQEEIQKQTINKDMENLY